MFLTDTESATSKRDKFILETSITEKLKLTMEPSSILMVHTMREVSRTPSSMAMVPFNMKIKP